MAHRVGKTTGKIKSVTIDLKNYGKQLQDTTDEFEKEWQEGYNIEEARTHLYKTIDGLEWNKKN